MIDPTAMLIANCSNDTMLGKVFLEREQDIDIKMYDNMYAVDKDDQKTYDKTSNASNLMVEGLSEDNPTVFGETYFKLPSFTEIASEIEDDLNSFKEL